MKLSKSILLFSMLPFAVAAQPPADMQSVPRQVSLNDAISMSLQASKQLRASQARVQQAQAGYTEARERRLPDFKITGAYMHVLSQDMDLKIATSKPDNSNNQGSESGSGSAMPSVEDLGYAMANLSVPLFAGFKIQSGIESAKYLAKASELDAQKDRADVILNTVSAYINLYKAEAATRLVQQNLNSARQRVRDLSNLEKNGLLARNDLLKAELQSSNVELALLDAQNNLHVAQVNMNLMLGLPEQTELHTDSSFQSATDTRDLQEWEQTAFANRKDAQALQQRSKAAEAGIRAAKADYYPSLALTGGYIGGYIPNFITISNMVNAGVGLSYSPSSLWKTGAKVNAAKAHLAETQAGMDMLEDGIRLQVTQAYEAWLLSNKKIEVYQTALAQANENYRIVKNKNANALATTTELLEADVAQLQAEINYAFARADATASYEKLLKAAGILDESIPANK